eukprot:SAG11_NODE_1227_length_5474_cov_5.294326_5_plen_466_part_00
MAAGRKLRLGLVGCGRICQVHWAGIEESASALIHVAACVDIFRPRAEEMAAKVAAATGEPCAAFNTMADALAAAELDAVDIMLLHNQHEAAAMEAFEAGVHVMLEKPMSISPASCGRVMRAARAAGKTFWIAEQAQYSPVILAARQLIADGAIGDTLTLHTMSGAAGPPAPLAAAAAAPEQPPPTSRGQGSVIAAAGLPADDLRVPLEGEGGSFGSGRVTDRAWRADKTIAGGGVVLDGGSHTIRPMRMLMQPHCGEVVSVAGAIKSLEPDREGESYTRTLMRFEHGQTAILEMGGHPKAVYGPAPWAHRVTGTAGEVRIASSSMMLYNGQHPDGKLIEVADRRITHGLLLQDFANACMLGTFTGVAAADSLGESLTAMAIVSVVVLSGHRELFASTLQWRASVPLSRSLYPITWPPSIVIDCVRHFFVGLLQYRSNESGQTEQVFTKEYLAAAGESVATTAARL